MRTVSFVVSTLTAQHDRITDFHSGANVADCLLVPIYDIAMCWVRLNSPPTRSMSDSVQDRFTTNVYFEDGTFGTVVTGEFNTTDGASINLVYGSYTMKDGTTGNIYGGAASSLTELDTSTMPIPSPWTSSGEGSAIPVTGLGTTASLSVVTTTIPPTTIPASTESSITILDTLTDCHHCPPYNTTISGPMQSEGTRPAITSVISTGVITPTISPNVGVSLFPYSTYCFIGPFIAAFAAQLVI